MMKRIGYYLFAIAFCLVGWHLTAVALNTPALPTPVETVPVLAANLKALVPDFCISFVRIFISLAIGTVFGALVGLALGRCPKADDFFAPVVYLLYPVPKIVLLPILLVLLGIGGAPKVLLIALTIFFQVIVVMRDAAKAIPKSTVLSVRSLGASRADIWRHVVIPATLPSLFTTLRVSSGIAVAILFFAESIVGTTGLGYFIMESWALVNYPRMFAGIIALAVLGVIFYIAFDVAERKLNHR